MVIKFVKLCFLATIFAVAYSVDYKDYKEGTCAEYKLQEDFNATWFANTALSYISAGSKYHLYRIASGYAPAAKLSEHEFSSKACLQAYVNTSTGGCALHGFGAGIIANYEILHVDKAGVYDYFLIPSTPPGFLDISKHYITLTDNESFVFFANCWETSNQRTWDVLSLTPRLDFKTQKLIEDHATSLGFDKRNFVFLRYDSCRTGWSAP